VLDGKIALVTGASRGIGRAIALELASAGADLILNYASSEAAVREVEKEIEALGRQCLPIQADVGSSEEVERMVSRAIETFGRIDVLVNNAGITKDGLAMRMKPEDWNLVLQINLTGAFYATQQVLPAMVKQRSGRIINIASVVGQAGNPGQANYVASKAGIIGLTKALAQEVASRSITVNAVAPGFIETDMTAVLPQEVRDKMLTAIPLKRMGRPEDVAAAVRFLASDDAQYITGHVINVNGGMYM
jgi:3-oxoacyl-[acyl-carrier protein] reductase